MRVRARAPTGGLAPPPPCVQDQAAPDAPERLVAAHGGGRGAARGELLDYPDRGAANCDDERDTGGTDHQSQPHDCDVLDQHTDREQDHPQCRQRVEPGERGATNAAKLPPRTSAPKTIVLTR